jgi:hypothetical protein
VAGNSNRARHYGFGYRLWRRHPLLNDGKDLIIVDGDLTKDDLQTFQRVVQAAPSGSTVGLRSNGGLVARHRDGHIDPRARARHACHR